MRAGTPTIASRAPPYAREAHGCSPRAGLPPRHALCQNAAETMGLGPQHPVPARGTSTNSGSCRIGARECRAGAAKDRTLRPEDAQRAPQHQQVRADCLRDRASRAGCEQGRPCTSRDLHPRRSVHLARPFPMAGATHAHLRLSVRLRVQSSQLAQFRCRID